MAKEASYVYFNKKEWLQRIKDPHWYYAVPPLLETLRILHDSDRSAYERTKEEIYSFIEEQLKAGNICFDNSGKHFDTDRKSIDTVVIHHTSNPPGMTLERLSAIEVVRLYAPQFAGKGPSYDANRQIKDAPLYSGHFRNGVQVFWPYHWIIRTDGSCERLLNDDEIGWQAGNWDINCRSVAIVFDNDYEESEPDDTEIHAAAKLIREEYSSVPKERIFGHCEINHKTSCPSKTFLGNGQSNGWKERLLLAIV